MKLQQRFLTNNPCYRANLQQADSRYATFQKQGPRGLMLHSVGCAQPSARVFTERWDSPNYTNACVHAFIDAGDGTVWQTLPWNYRGWHCAGSGNNTHVGVEMCESAHIRYTSGAAFEVLDREKALADCRRTYAAAVELFAALCLQYGLDPLTAICSHREGGLREIASRHADPEHYWNGLGAGYTMDGFRADAAAALEALQAPAEPELPFTDVEKDRFYYEPVLWAVETGVTKGTSATTFSPDKPCTRGEVVTMLYRAFNTSNK